jgi:molybdenum cofactor cytidylyltransferase
MKHYGIIILAAGESKRFGSPKQLAEFKDKTLLQHAIDEAAKVDKAAVCVVLGAHKEDILAKHKTAHIIAGINEDWESGMASSIQVGLHRLQQNYTDLKGCIIAVSDQPFLKAKILEHLIEKQKETGAGIVASAYAGTLGTPAYLDRKYFDELMALKGNGGAKQLLETHKDDLAQIDFEQGEIDIDRPEDLAAITES